MGGLFGTVSQNKSSLVIIAAASQVKVKGLMPVLFSIVSKMRKHQGGPSPGFINLCEASLGALKWLV